MDIPDINLNININGLPDHTAQLNRMEALMSQVNDELVALKAQLDDTKSDVLARVATMQTLIEQLQAQLGTLDPQAQETLDAIVSELGDLDTAIGDADGSDTPPAPEPAP